MKSESSRTGLGPFERGPGQLLCPLRYVRLQRKNSHLGSGLPPDTESAGNLVLDLPASRTVRNTFLLFIRYLPGLRYFCYSSANGLRRQVLFILPPAMGTSQKSILSYSFICQLYLSEAREKSPS